MVMRVATSLLALAAVFLSASAFAGSRRILGRHRQILRRRGQAWRVARDMRRHRRRVQEQDAEAPAQTGLDMMINFDLDSVSLTPDAQAKLDQFAKALKDNRLKTLTFVVEGHTDASGSAAYNEGLSQRRAQSVTAFLLSSGIESSRIGAVGMGETHPRNANPYDPVNRRVEMRLNQ